LSILLVGTVPVIDITVYRYCILENYRYPFSYARLLPLHDISVENEEMPQRGNRYAAPLRRWVGPSSVAGARVFGAEPKSKIFGRLRQRLETLFQLVKRYRTGTLKQS